MQITQRKVNTVLFTALFILLVVLWWRLAFPPKSNADSTKHLHAECTVNDSDHPCDPGLVCTPDNPNSNNGKCELAPTPTPSASPTPSPSGTPNPSSSPTPCDDEDCVQPTPSPTPSPSPTPTTYSQGSYDGNDGLGCASHPCYDGHGQVNNQSGIPLQPASASGK